MKKKESIIKCVAAILAAGLVESTAGIVSGNIPQGNMQPMDHEIFSYFIMTLIEAIGLILVLLIFKRSDVLRFRKKGSFKTGFIVALVMIAYYVWILVTSLIECIREYGSPSLSPIFLVIYFVGLFLGAGIGEEVLCRGIFMNFIRDAAGYKTRKGLLISMILSSLFFGVMHLANLLGTDDVVGTIGQVIYASGIGFYLAAVYARCKNLWFNIFLHFFVDAAALLEEIFKNTRLDISDIMGSSNTEVIVSSVVICVVYTLLGLFLIRKKKMPELTE